MHVTVKRNVSKLCGKARKPGDELTAAEAASINPQVLKALVDAGTLEVEGMAPSGGGSSGMQAHQQARLDNLTDRVKRLEGQVAELLGIKPPKVAAPKPAEAPKAAKAAKAAKAKTPAAKAEPAVRTRRSATLAAAEKTE